MGNNNKNVFVNFVSTYFIIIALVLVCLFPIFIALEHAERDKATQAIEDYAESTMREMENTETLFFNTARSFYTSRTLQNTYYNSTRTHGTTLFYNMVQLQENLKLHIQNVDDISDIIIYIPKFDYVLTPKYIFSSRTQFYQLYQFESMPETDWLRSYMNPDHNLTVTADRITDRVSQIPDVLDSINHFFVFPMNGDANIQLLTIIAQDSHKLARSFLLPDIREQAYAVITDASGNQLASSEELPVSWSGNHAPMISLRNSDQTLIEIFVNDTYYQNIRADVLNLLLRNIGTALVISAAVALIFAWNRSRPIERILAIIRQSEMADLQKDDFLAIEDTVVNMASEIQHCKLTIENLNSMVSHSLLERIFFGELSSPKTEESFISYYGPMPESCIIAVMTTETAVSEELLSQRVADICCSLGQDIYVSHVHKGSLYYLLLEEETLQQKLEQVLKCYRETYNQHLKAGISNPISALASVKGATSQAERRLQSGFQLQGIYLFSHTYSSKTARNPASVQTLDSLQRTLLTGNQDAADKLIEDLFQNMSPEKTSMVDLRQLFFSLRTVYSLVINQFRLEAEKMGGNAFEWIALPNDLDEYSIDTVKAAFLELNRAIYQYYQKQQDRTARIRGLDVMNYIEENFRDTNLCATSIAEHFGLSEKYVFQLSKRTSGETLNDRISALRVAESIRLLETTTLSIADIAQKSGFTSSNSMYKVFMRVKGVAPSSFRKKK